MTIDTRYASAYSAVFRVGRQSGNMMLYSSVVIMSFAVLVAGESESCLSCCETMIAHQRLVIIRYSGSEQLDNDQFSVVCLLANTAWLGRRRTSK